MDIDLRLAIYMIWGLGAVLVWGDVLRYRFVAFRKYHDRRARRALLAAIALFICAFSAAIAIFFVLFGPAGIGVRGFAVAVFLGAFLGAGFYMRDVAEDGRP